MGLLAGPGPPGLASERMDSLDLPPQSLLVVSANPDRVPFSIALGQEERRHVRALRLRSGARIRVTNGRGAMWEGRLEGADGAAACRLETPLVVEPLLPVELAFGVAAKTRTLWLVEKAVELGVGVLQPIEFARSASVADGARSPAFWSKARRRAEAALEQSGGAWLPELRDPIALDTFLTAARDGATGANGTSDHLLLLPSAERELTGWLTSWTGQRRLTLLVGPEGGLETVEQHAIIGSGFRPARLGSRMLRFETAAVAAVVVAAQRAAVEKQVSEPGAGSRSDKEQE